MALRDSPEEDLGETKVARVRRRNVEIGGFMKSVLIKRC